MSYLDVEYIVCETIPKNNRKKAKKIKLMTERDLVSIGTKVAGMKHNIDARILHFGVNSNKVTIGHKLQRASLNRMIVRS